MKCARRLAIWVAAPTAAAERGGRERERKGSDPGGGRMTGLDGTRREGGGHTGFIPLGASCMTTRAAILRRPSPRLSPLRLLLARVRVRPCARNGVY